MPMYKYLQNYKGNIAHGDVVSNKVEDYKSNLALLSKEFISIYFFKTQYDKVQLDAKIYDSLVIFTKE